MSGIKRKTDHISTHTVTTVLLAIVDAISVRACVRVKDNLPNTVVLTYNSWDSENLDLRNIDIEISSKSKDIMVRATTVR